MDARFLKGGAFALGILALVVLINRLNLLPYTTWNPVIYQTVTPVPPTREEEAVVVVTKVVTAVATSTHPTATPTFEEIWQQKVTDLSRKIDRARETGTVATVRTELQSGLVELEQLLTSSGPKGNEATDYLIDIEILRRKLDNASPTDTPALGRVTPSLGMSSGLATSTPTSTPTPCSRSYFEGQVGRGEWKPAGEKEPDSIGRFSPNEQINAVPQEYFVQYADRTGKHQVINPGTPVPDEAKTVLVYCLHGVQGR